MVAVNDLTGPQYQPIKRLSPKYHPTKPLADKYVVKPIDERVQQMHDYLLRLRIQKELDCGCNGITTMTCPACDEAMECQCGLHPDREVMACLVCRIYAQMRAEKDEALER